MKIYRIRASQIEDLVLINPINTERVISEITAGVTTRDMLNNLVRVKSSNVWAYGINIKRANDRTGDVLTQFKGPGGGPGDVYIYYDIPIALYRKWHSAPSKGSFHWKYIRNNFRYSKLTGDRRTKLKNGVTSTPREA